MLRIVVPEKGIDKPVKSMKGNLSVPSHRGVGEADPACGRQAPLLTLPLL
jgi:hypothetical protein